MPTLRTDEQLGVSHGIIVRTVQSQVWLVMLKIHMLADSAWKVTYLESSGRY